MAPGVCQAWIFPHAMQNLQVCLHEVVLLVVFLTLDKNKKSGLQPAQIAPDS